MGVGDSPTGRLSVATVVIGSTSFTDHVFTVHDHLFLYMKETFLKQILVNFFVDIFFTKKAQNMLVKTISCWVLIKRSLAGKLALCSQILNWMSLFPEKGKQSPKFDHFEKTPNFRGFWPFS